MKEEIKNKSDCRNNLDKEIEAMSMRNSIEGLIQVSSRCKGVSISVSSPEEIIKNSYGETISPETLNYRTLKPEVGGLFCERIYGPIKDFECGCGVHHSSSSRESICERCGVPIAPSFIRRQRMSHINLVTPSVNPIFINYIHLLLDIPISTLNKIIAYEIHVVVSEESDSSYKYKQLFTEIEYQGIVKEIVDSDVILQTGSESIYTLLSQVNLYKLKDSLDCELKKKHIELKRKKFIKLKGIVESFIDNKKKPQWLVFQSLPICPAGLRPLLPIESGKFVSSDLNDKYRAVIYRNNRLKMFMNKLSFIAPREIVNNEKRMLHQSIVNLIVGEPNKSSSYRSIAAILQGKYGLLRNKMLGKRVDYSGRAVITTCADLKIGECGVPKSLLKDLCRPFLYRLIKKYNLAVTISGAKSLVDREVPEIWDLLAEVIKDKYVLLNRAPTLYKLGIQAFRPKMISGCSIQIHPLVCAAYNADFDGDQMAIHMPLFVEAQMEAQILMNSRNNILSPVSGRPVINPTRDIMLGLYYLTLGNEKSRKSKEELRLVGSLGEVEYLLYKKIVHLHEYIYYRYEYISKSGEKLQDCCITTPGRAILWSRIPSSPHLPFSLINKNINNQEAQQLLNLCHINCGREPTVEMAENFKELGFEYVFKSAASFGKHELSSLKNEKKIIDFAWTKYEMYEKYYRDKLISREDKHNKIIQLVDQVTKIAHKSLEQDLKEHPSSPLSLMILSGSRGSIEQLRQMKFFKGLSVNPNGTVSENPCFYNFRTGLPSLYYFDATRGARKGGKDRAINTAVTGYLTRRMADVAQDCVIRMKDCGTSRGITIDILSSSLSKKMTLYDYLYGRVNIKPIVDSRSGKILYEINTFLTHDIVKNIERYSISPIVIRSPVTCESDSGICSKCYGIEASTGRIVSVGDTVGIIAAQSIGEPGTQLTMKTFQTGNVAKSSIDEPRIYSQYDGVVELEGYFINKYNSEGTKCLVMMSTKGAIVIKNKMKGETLWRREVDYGCLFSVFDGSSVAVGDMLYEDNNIHQEFISEKDGYIRYDNLIQSLTVEEVSDDSLGINYITVIENKSNHSSHIVPMISVTDKDGNVLNDHRGVPIQFILMVGTRILKKDKESVKCGESIAQYQMSINMAGDIIDGLGKVISILEARSALNPAIISHNDGVINISADGCDKRKIQILSVDDNTPIASYIINKVSISKILVRNGDKVSVGDFIVDGQPVLQDILNVKGLEQLVYYFTSILQDIYREQGVPLSNIHLEVILKQMLRIVEVNNNGKSKLIEGSRYDIGLVRKLNKRLSDKKLPNIAYNHIVLGITQAALRNPSFLSAASFQEPLKVLTESAILSKTDHLKGLKENVILGQKTPSGTGEIMREIYNIIDKMSEKGAIS